LPDIGDEYSLYRSRSVSVSSSSSANSTGTVCESEIFPYGKGIAPHRKKRSTSPPSRNATPKQTVLDNSGDNIKISGISDELDSRSSKKSVATSIAASVKANWKNADAAWRKKLVETPDLLPDKVVSREDNPFVKGISSAQVRSNMEQEDDTQSVSTVSGSGIDFFRKFVQRKGASCKDCEDQFRREVLIDRLVSDSLNTKAALGARRSKESSEASCHNFSGSEMSRPMSEMSNSSLNSVNHSLIVSSLGEQDMEQKARGCASRCKTHRQANQATPCDDTQSVSTSTKSSVSSSSISGSGLLFLRNYLKKKKSKSRAKNPDGSSQKSDPNDISAFNIVPVPFPPPSDFYGPAFMQDGGPDNMSDTSSDRRLSVCSTVADLLNEDFDCDDSELKNLDWEEWDEPLPDDISYDDLVSVISESFYSDDLDLADLCELDWEGRKTVVANDRQVLTPDEQSKIVNDVSSNKSPNKEFIGEPSKNPERNRSSKESTFDSERNESSKSKYGSYKSSTFMQDLEAELELPPMTPVSDEKEEAVRALSRTISQYMRTGSNSSYTTDPGRLSRQSSNNEQGRYSRKSTHEELERNSRMSVYSPAMSDYLPELASSSASPAPFRRPLSQLLAYDVPASSPQCQYSVTPPPDLNKLEDSHKLQSLLSGQKLPIWAALNCNSPPNLNNSHKEVPPVPGQMSNILNLPRGVYSLTPEGKSQNSSPNNTDAELAAHNSSPFELRNRSSGSKTKNSNRDSLLCTNNPYTPPLCSSPSMYSQCAPTTRIPYLRHSSSNSTDSGCPLLDDKIASLSPTPSPRTNIEVLSSNRNKLASFWEKSVVTTSASEIPLAWITNKENPEENFRRQGFQPFRSAFGSENSLVVNDRLAHFQDVTRRAAAERNPRGRNLQRAHRASTGSDCSDFFDKITMSPAQTRRRESFTEYFV